MMWIISFVWRRRTPASLNLIVRGRFLCCDMHW